MIFFKTGLGKNPVVSAILKLITFIKNPIDLEGMKLYLPLSDGWDYINRPRFYHTEVMKQNLREGDTAVEVGACIGFHTLIMSKCVGEKGKVIAYEPEPENFKLLARNLSVNNLKCDFRQKAVSDKKGTAKLFTSVGSKYPQLFKNYMTKGYVEVPAVVLDEEVEKADFLKIDAMGSEAKIIRGAKRFLTRNPKIKLIIQYSPSKIEGCGDDPVEPLKTIQSLGFAIEFIDEKKKMLIKVRDIEDFARQKFTREILCKRGNI